MNKTIIFPMSTSSIGTEIPFTKETSFEIRLHGNLKYTAYDPERHISTEGEDPVKVAKKHAAKIFGRKTAWAEVKITHVSFKDKFKKAGHYTCEL